jgi:hypothetical protein
MSTSSSTRTRSTRMPNSSLTSLRPESCPKGVVEVIWSFVSASDETVVLNDACDIAVYLRGEEETRQLYQAAVTVNPKFKEEETERAYSLQLKLVLTTTEAWVKVPEFLALAHDGPCLIACL